MGWKLPGVGSEYLVLGSGRKVRLALDSFRSRKMLGYDMRRHSIGRQQFRLPAEG
jgi:hypothetical protein